MLNEISKKRYLIAGNNILVKACNDNIFNIRITKNSEFSKRESLIVQYKNEFKIGSSEDGYVLSTAEISCHINEQTGVVEFFSKKGELILKDNGTSDFVARELPDGPAFEVKQSFGIREDEAIFGMGMHQNNMMNYHQDEITTLDMNQQNPKQIVSPLLVSGKGYGILWDNYSYGKVEITGNEIIFSNDTADEINYYFIYGPSADEVIAGARLLTGAAPMLPKWAYGFFQSRERYCSQQELLSVAEEFRIRKIPIDTIVQDWNYWGDLGWNALKFDEKIYPDPEEMVRKLHEELNMKIMISIWPGFGPQTEVCKEMEEQGCILEGIDRERERWGRNHDVFSETAADIYWKHVNKSFYSIGIDAWWMDATEPCYDRDSSLILKELKGCALGDLSRYLNTYAFKTSENLYKRNRKASVDKRVYILTRSGFLGQQRNATSCWSGDIEGTWELFKKQIPALLQFSISGIPYSTTDIGGFFVNYPEGNKNPEYRELYTRWFWFGAFSPIFRSHGTSTPREMWFFGEPGTPFYDSQMNASNLRYRLLPYIYSVAWMVTKGYTLMRPLVMDFGSDTGVYDIKDQFMFGPSIMASVVTEPGTVTKEVYMPAGTVWYDFFTGKRTGSESGTTVTCDAAIDKTPVHIKAGSIIPMGPFLQYSSEKPADPVELRVYPGADAHFELYEDENDNYNYEKGAYSIIPFYWSDADRKLVIGKRSGSFNGMQENRTFNIVIVSESHGTGIDICSKPNYTVMYNGDAIELSF